MWRFLWDPVSRSSKLRRLSWMNRQADCPALSTRADLLLLHRRLNQVLADAEDHWNSYDYGRRVRQGWSEIGISIFRDTGAPLEQMRLRERVDGRTVLEIGCNSGFLSSAIAEHAESVTGFDLDPYMVAVAQIVADQLVRSDVDFMTSGFEEFQGNMTFDAVLFLANHSTCDDNTRQDTYSFLARCHRVLSPGGRLLFESHPPAWEGNRLKDVIRTMVTGFAVLEQKILTGGTLLDQGCTFIVAEPRDGQAHG